MGGIFVNQEVKKSIPSVVIFILVIALIVCFVKIRSLESDIQLLRSDLVSEVSMLRTDIQSIYNNVDTMLKAEASLVSGLDVEYGVVDVENHTIDLTVKLVPKLISEDMKLRLSINGRSTELTGQGTGFSGVIPVDLFNVDEQLLLTIETDAGVQTQYLPEIQTEYLWEGRIPSLYYCDISGTGSFAQGKYSLNAELDINCSGTEETPGVRFEEFMLVTELNGEEINREDISADVLGYEGYPHGVYFRHDYYMECEAVEGDELAIYVEAVDSLGYIHRRLLHFWKEQRGALAEAADASEYIFDPNGVQIFP